MKKQFKIFSLIAVIAILFVSCNDDNDGPPKIKIPFVSISVSAIQIINGNQSFLKSASVSEIDSVEIYFYYLNEGSWNVLSKDNFNSESEANLNFQNPLKVAYSDTIQLPYVAKAQCKFVFKGYDLSGNKTFLGQVEQDLRDATEDWIFSANLFETKSYFGLKILELVPSEDSIIFNYSYVLKQIDSAAMLNNLGTFGLNFPDFQFESSGDAVTGQLIVNGETVTLNGTPVNYSDYVDITENWNRSAPEGIDFTVDVYRDESKIMTSSLSGNFISLGENNYIQILNNTSGSAVFTLIQNGNVYSDWELTNLNLSDSLILYYDFEEASGNLLDITSNGHDGTNNGATQGAPGLIGNAYNFNGSTNYISLGSANNIVGGVSNMTINLWINSRQINYRGMIISSANGINGNDESVIMQLWNNSTTGNTFCTSGGTGLGGVSISSSGLNSDTWYCFTSILDTDSIRLYIDGIKVGSAVRIYSDPISTTTNALVLGRLGTYNAYYFDGLMDELGIWNRALSADEIQFLYNNGNGRAFSQF